MNTPPDAVLLDTSVIIDFPASGVSSLGSAGAVSVITLAELAFGMHSGDTMTSAARQWRYRWVLRSFLAIPFDGDAAEIYGALCADVRSAGRDPRPRRVDLLIAAVAVSRSLPLVTRNAKDFAGLHRVLRVIAID